MKLQEQIEELSTFNKDRVRDQASASFRTLVGGLPHVLRTYSVVLMS